MPIVRVLRPFANGHHEDIVQPGDEIAVSLDRVRDLGDLVEPVSGLKAAPAPDTKPAPVPANKIRSVPAGKPGRKPLARLGEGR